LTGGNIKTGSANKGTLQQELWEKIW